MTTIRGILLLTLMATIPATSLAAVNDDGVTVVRHRPAEDENDKRARYFLDILQLALEKTREDYGDFRLEVAGLQISQERAFNLIERDRLIDIVWTMTTRERESRALPIRIPLLKGLLGWRVLLVRREDVEQFTGITNVIELGKLVGVQGEGWPDTEILRDNGLEIVTSTDYEGMFRMIELGRADYFPRSVLEVGPELESFGALDLAVASTPVLTYVAPIYFFVNAENHALAERLRKGLERAIADGSFDRVFRNQEGFAQAEAFINSTDRFLRLQNPELPSETPTESEKLWYADVDWKVFGLRDERNALLPGSNEK